MTKPRAFSAGLIVVRTTPTEVRYLVVRCFRNWDFPKGIVEDGESPIIAARRETAEETSLTDVDFPWGEIYCDTAPYAGGKIARYYLARWRSGDVVLPIAPELGKPENDEFRWVGAQEAQGLLPARLQAVFAWAHRYAESYT